MVDIFTDLDSCYRIFCDDHRSEERAPDSDSIPGKFDGRFFNILVSRPHSNTRMKMLSISIPREDQLSNKPYLMMANNPTIVMVRIRVKKGIDKPVKP